MRIRPLEATEELSSCGARPEEIAYGVLFLASDEAPFVIGSALVVDGGQTIDV